MRSLLTPAALLGALATTALACNEPAPTRVWSPEDHAHPAASAAPSQVPAPPTAEEEAEGTARARALVALYQVKCASCHGADGRGDGPERPPGAEMPDFTSVEWQNTRNDEALADTIAHGGTTMPSFADEIAEENIFGLVERVRAFAGAPSGAAAAPEGEAPADEAPNDAIHGGGAAAPGAVAPAR